MKKNHEIYFKKGVAPPTYYCIGSGKSHREEKVCQNNKVSEGINRNIPRRKDDLKIYALELKSFKDMPRYKKAIDQAGEYGVQMGLKEIFLLVFVELSQEEAKQLEQEVDKSGIKVIVLPIGIL